MLESFRKLPKTRMTNSTCPLVKEKESQICYQFVQTIGILSWLSLCFNIAGTLVNLIYQVVG